jgi:hypothetical protein
MCMWLQGFWSWKWIDGKEHKKQNVEKMNIKNFQLNKGYSFKGHRGVVLESLVVFLEIQRCLIHSMFLN